MYLPLMDWEVKLDELYTVHHPLLGPQPPHLGAGGGCISSGASFFTNQRNTTRSDELDTNCNWDLKKSQANSLEHLNFCVCPRHPAGLILRTLWRGPLLAFGGS